MKRDSPETSKNNEKMFKYNSLNQRQEFMKMNNTEKSVANNTLGKDRKHISNFKPNIVTRRGALINTQNIQQKSDFPKIKKDPEKTPTKPTDENDGKEESASNNQKDDKEEHAGRCDGNGEKNDREERDEKNSSATTPVHTTTTANADYAAKNDETTANTTESEHERREHCNADNPKQNEDDDNVSTTSTPSTDSQEERRIRLPPITTEGFNTYDLIHKLHSIDKDAKFAVKNIGEKKCNIFANSIDNYNKIKQMLSEANIPFYSFTPMCNKVKSIVLKGL